MQRLSLAIWTIIGMLLLSTAWMLHSNHMLTALISGAPIEVTLQEPQITGGDAVQGGKIDIQLTATGQVEEISTVYADFRQIGGPRIDLRSTGSGSFLRQHIPIPLSAETGNYLIPVRVILSNRIQKEVKLNLTLSEALHGAAEESTPTPELEATTPQTPLGEETEILPLPEMAMKPVITVSGSNTLQVFIPTPLHANSIMASGEQFSLHYSDNYFREVEIERVTINSTGEVLTIYSKGLEKGKHFVLVLPETPLKGLDGEEVLLGAPLSFQYAERTALPFHMNSAVQTTHQDISARFTRDIDMQSLVQGEPVCELWSKKYGRVVGYSAKVRPLESDTLRITMEQSIPTGELDLSCKNLQGSFGAKPIGRVLRQTLQSSNNAQDQQRYRYRSDFNQDGSIDEADLALLLDAMSSR